MNKQITKQIFGVPSLETAGRIDDSDKCTAFEAAHYRRHQRTVRRLSPHGRRPRASQ